MQLSIIVQIFRMSTYRYCKISAASHNMKLFCRISAANEFKVFILCRAADILQHKYDVNLIIDLSDSMTVFCMIKASKPEKDSISLCQTYQYRLIHCDVGNRSG